MEMGAGAQSAETKSLLSLRRGSAPGQVVRQRDDWKQEQHQHYDCSELYPPAGQQGTTTGVAAKMTLRSAGSDCPHCHQGQAENEPQTVEQYLHATQDCNGTEKASKNVMIS